MIHPQNIEFIFGCIAAKIIIANKTKFQPRFKISIKPIKTTVFFCFFLIALSGFSQYYNIQIFNLLTGIHVLIYGIISTILILCLAFLDIWKINKDLNYEYLVQGTSIINRHVLLSGMILLREASYSVYLTHRPALSALSKFMKHLRVDELIGGFWASNILFALVVASGSHTHMLSYQC
ncbi:hypothetical protein IQ226_16760 [Dolichospermum sp. LEGE 00240]|uniref:hypothetical protein n=1 Tax=Dolichospermum sp. LEGE 00240 TaxID=1828603 RepID=UPI00187E27AE|nr:hypothetical protein [Dolichospermum sp. LEGE 00240]MBE9250752.1 hypothetical protein [Dolichospermum sp. LEGE 00240]